jgi:hypothetical protein
LCKEFGFGKCVYLLFAAVNWTPKYHSKQTNVW